jgi:gliding motility-associated-like protein
MPKLYTSLIIAVFVLGKASAQTVRIIWSENFNNNPNWTLNADGQQILPGSTPGNPPSDPNTWFVGNGGGGADLFDGTPNLRVSCAGGLCDFFGGPAAPVYNATVASNQAAYMNVSIPADSFQAGLTSRLRFFWRCRGGNNANNGAARLIYSVDDGQNWNELPKNYHNNNAWLKDSIEINPANFPNFIAGVTSLRFGFRWFNNLAFSGVNDPPMLVDNMSVTRTVPPVGITLTSITANPSQGPITQVCPGSSILVNFIPVGNFPPGTTFNLQLSEPGGTFGGSPTSLGVTNASPFTLNFPGTVAPGNYAVRVVSSNNVISTNTLNITVLPGVTPQISITASPGTNVCAGTQITFTATTINGGNSPQISWRVNDIPVQFAAGPVFTSAIGNNETVTAVLTSNAQCANPATVVSNSITITTSPVVVTSLQYENPGAIQTNVCEGATVNLSLIAQGGGSNPEYRWYLNGVRIPNANGLSIELPSLANGDQVFAEMRSSATCVSDSVVRTAALIFNVFPVVTPLATITASPSANVCEGTPITFTANVRGVGSSPTFAWIVNGSVVPNVTDTVYTAVFLNNDQVAFRLISNAFCATKPGDTSNVITVTTGQPVTPAVILRNRTGSNNICAGETVRLGVDVQNAGPAPLYRWFINSVLQSDISDSTLTTTALADGDTVRVTLISDAACAVPKEVTSGFIVFQVNALEVPSVSLRSTSTPICSNKNLTFQAFNVVGGGSTPDFTWVINGDTVSVASAPTLNRAALNAGDRIYVVMTSSATCKTSATATSDTLTVLASPNITMQEDTTISIFTPVFALEASPSGGTWSARGLEANNNFNPRKAGVGIDTVRYTVVSSNGCSSVGEQKITVFRPEQEVYDAVTPNGDGQNDEWQALSNIQEFPNCVVSIFNRYGVLVYKSKRGYPKPWWDGKTTAGEDLPAGTYYFIIDLGTGESLKGNVTLIR